MLNDHCSRTLLLCTTQPNFKLWKSCESIQRLFKMCGSSWYAISVLWTRLISCFLSYYLAQCWIWITQGRSLTARSWPCSMAAKITFSKHLQAPQKNKKAFIKLCPREQACYLSLKVKSIYRISQLSNLFFFKRLGTSISSQ